MHTIHSGDAVFPYDGLERRSAQETYRLDVRDCIPNTIEGTERSLCVTYMQVKFSNIRRHKTELQADVHDERA